MMMDTSSGKGKSVCGWSNCHVQDAATVRVDVNISCSHNPPSSICLSLAASSSKTTVTRAHVIEIGAFIEMTYLMPLHAAVFAGDQEPLDMRFYPQRKRFSSLLCGPVSSEHRARTLHLPVSPTAATLSTYFQRCPCIDPAL
jgi:hypothetical protein